MKRKVFMIGAILCAGIALFAGIKIWQHYANDRKYTEEFEKLADIAAQETDEDTEIPEIPYDEERTVLDDYALLYRQNNDMIGWIRIEGTTINYPVMYTPDRPNYYLNKNFDKQYSAHGVPYIDEDCNPNLPSDNLIIYGHHIRNGKMFGALKDYTSKQFYDSHKIIQFDTLVERGEYEIVVVFKTTVYDNRGFRYYDFIQAETEAEFTDYIDQCKVLALYDTGVSAAYGDKLITLSTCEYSAVNGRLVVVAKRVE